MWADFHLCIIYSSTPYLAGMAAKRCAAEAASTDEAPVFAASFLEYIDQTCATLTQTLALPSFRPLPFYLLV